MNLEKLDLNIILSKPTELSGLLIVDGLIADPSLDQIDLTLS